MKGTTTLIQIGEFLIDGILTDDGQFMVGVPQIAEQFRFDNHNSSRDLKALMGVGSQFTKIQTPLNSKAINCITIKQFEQVLLELAMKGNPGAIALSRSLVGLSLHQLFCDAFDIHFTKLERQEWLLQRQSGTKARNRMTEAVAGWLSGVAEVSQPRKLYSQVTNSLYKGLFGQTADEIREEAGSDQRIARNLLTKEQLSLVAIAEKMVMKKVDRGMNPLDAVAETISDLADSL